MNLQLIILPAKSPLKTLKSHYLSAYETFHQVWRETYQSIHGDEFKMYSNDFSRQDYIQALFDGEQCVALVCMRMVDIENPVDRQDSWFQTWTEKEWATLECWVPDKFLVGSYFTVHPDYRKSQPYSGDHVSKVMGYLSAWHNIEIGHPNMVGMMRKDRSMDKLGRLWGSIPLGEIQHNGVPSEIVLFRESQMRKVAPTFPSYVAELMNSRIDPFKKGHLYDEHRKVA